MAVKTTIVDTAIVPGSRRQTVSTVQLDSEYAAEGEPVTVAELGLTRLDWGLCLPLQGSEAETVEFGFAKLEKKTDTTAVIRAYNYKTQKEVATGKDCSKIIVQVVAYGK